MDTKFKVGDIFLRGFAYPTQWEVINTKLILKNYISNKKNLFINRYFT